MRKYAFKYLRKYVAAAMRKSRLISILRTEALPCASMQRFVLQKTNVTMVWILIVNVNNNNLVSNLTASGQCLGI